MIIRTVVNDQTKQYAQRFYQILKEADVIALEKYAASYDFSNTNPELFGRRLLIEEYKKENNVTITATNKKYLTNDGYQYSGEQPIYDYSFKIVRRNTYNSYNIEQFTETLYIMNNETQMELNIPQMQFYNDRNLDVTSIINQNLESLINITAIGFFHSYENHMFQINSFVSKKLRNDTIVLTFNVSRI